MTQQDVLLLLGAVFIAPHINKYLSLVVGLFYMSSYILGLTK